MYPCAMNAPLLSGPSVVPPNPTHALVCLHGFGADGNDLIALAPPLQQALSKPAASDAKFSLAVFSPHAPFPDELGQGRQWFHHSGWRFNDAPGLKLMAQSLEDYLNVISKKHGIPRNHIALLGFSQGAMTVLHALPSLTVPPSAVIALSGGLTVEPTIDETHPTTPILFIHGLEDDVWPADHTVKGEEFYRKHGYPTQLELLPGLAHGIDARALAHTTLFLGEIWHSH
jgi:phospholipase/carboxylesterase